MKYRLSCLAAVAAMLAGVLFLQNYESKPNRYHQHLENKPYTPCTDHGDDVFCTHLPLFNIVTDAPIPDPFLYDDTGKRIRDEAGSPVSNNEMVAASVEFFTNSGGNNHLTDEPDFFERGLIRIRGNWSRSFDKKGYLIKFTEQDMVTGKKVSIDGMTADSEWVLHGPFLDKTLIRNYLCYNLSGEIMDYAPNVRFCELILNNEYMGVYLLVEKIKQNDNGRIFITETDPKLETTSYIVRVDRGASDELHSLSTFASYMYINPGPTDVRGQLEIEYPGKSLTQEQHDYIANDISKFEKALFSFDYTDRSKGYRQYVDVDSFVDFFLINEFTLNYDAPFYSTYLYKDIREKLQLCVWDFNSAFDYYELSSISPETFLMQSSMWYQYLFKDKSFVDDVIDRYYELRETFFNEAYLFQYIDETVAYLGPAVERNFEKWGYSFGAEYDYLTPAERNVRSYDEAIAQVKDCISNRIDHMDSNLDRLYYLCHGSTNKVYNYDSNSKGALQ